MKLVREHINEKFSEESDPIHDMGIGQVRNIKKWIKDFVKLRSMPNVYEGMFKINGDGSIDVEGDLDISYTYMSKLPDYIKFNHIKGEFCCCYTYYDVMKKNGPKIVDGDYKIYESTFVFNKSTIRKYCKIKGEIEIHAI